MLVDDVRLIKYCKTHPIFPRSKAPVFPLKLSQHSCKGLTRTVGQTLGWGTEVEMEVIKFGLGTITEPVVNEFSPAVNQERTNSEGTKELSGVCGVFPILHEISLSESLHEMNLFKQSLKGFSLLFLDRKKSLISLVQTLSSLQFLQNIFAYTDLSLFTVRTLSLRKKYKQAFTSNAL